MVYTDYKPANAKRQSFYLFYSWLFQGQEKGVARRAKASGRCAVTTFWLGQHFGNFLDGSK
jgi:hypothetical protein